MRRLLADDALVLRPLVARDAGELYMLLDRHRDLLSRYMNWLPQTRSANDLNFYILKLDGFWRSGITYGIFENDQMLGTVGFHQSDHRNSRTEVGYWLAPPFHNRGIGTRSVRLALETAFNLTDVHRIEAKIQPDNRASIRLVEKLGFQFEGLEREGVRFDSGYRDHRIYSLLRGEL